MLYIVYKVFCMNSQDLKSGDLVLQQLLGFVEVGQHVLCFSVVKSVELCHLSLVFLTQVLFVSSENTQTYTKISS